LFSNVCIQNLKVKEEIIQWLGEISDSHGGEYEDDCLLGYCTVQSGISLPISEVFAASIIRALTHSPDDGAASTSKTSVNFYQTTRRNILEDSHLQSVVQYPGVLYYFLLAIFFQFHTL
jgi:hypothetical protein